MKRVSAVLLAAGLGKRSRAFKPLLPWGGETFVTKVLRSLREAEVFSEIILVTGHEAAKLEVLPRETWVRSVLNEDYAQGMHRSIRKGLHALAEPWDAALIAHVDQPQLDARDYRHIVRSFCASARSLARPEFGGRPGNPAVIGRSHLAEIDRHRDGDHGCHYLFESYPEDTWMVSMPDGKCLTDYDESAPLVP